MTGIVRIHIHSPKVGLWLFGVIDSSIMTRVMYEYNTCDIWMFIQDAHEFYPEIVLYGEWFETFEVRY